MITDEEYKNAKQIVKEHERLYYNAKMREYRWHNKERINCNNRKRKNELYNDPIEKERLLEMANTLV